MPEASVSLVAREFLRQASSPDPRFPVLIDLTSLWEAAGRSHENTPERYSHPTDRDGFSPYANGAPRDGRVYGRGIKAVDYAMTLDPSLDALSFEFQAEGERRGGLILALLDALTPEHVFVAVAMIVTVRERFASAADAAKELLGVAEFWGTMRDPFTAETTVARVHRALRGDVAFP